MQTKKAIGFLARIGDIVLIVSAILSIGVALLDFVGALQGTSWLAERIPALILLSVSFMLVSVLVERALRLDAIQVTLDSILSKYTIGVQYLENLESVVTELERIARQADENIMALGSRSTAPRYLKAIQDAVRRRGVVYYRLIDGTHIEHLLHEHLRTMLQSENVRIAWTPKEKFGNMAVTEDECIIAFPAPYRSKLSGLRLPGETNSRRWSQYFLEVFSQSHAVREEKSIEILCEKCGSTIKRNPEEILRLMQENQSTMTPQDSPDLL